MRDRPHQIGVRGPSALIRTAEGSNREAYAAADWAMLLTNTLVWGSSFLFIAIAIDAFTPGMVAWLRVMLGGAVLWAIPGARKPVERRDWGAILIVAVAGNAGPALLFAFAEQTVESSVAGMLTAAVPLVTAGIAFGLGQRSLRPIHVIGLVGGLIGVVLLSVPSLTGEQAAVAGVAMVLLAVAGYALTSNVLVPLAQTYGSAPIIARALVISSVLLFPFGLVDLSANRFESGPVMALLALGLLSTGMSRVIQAVLIGRVGAPRASIVGYLIPLIALVLGALFRGDEVSAVEVAGLVVALTSAVLTTRAVRI